MSKMDHIYFFFGFAGWGNKFHETAKEMLKQGISRKFSGITFGSGSYKAVRDQTDVKYENLDAYEDLYPRFLEQPYNEKRVEQLEDRYGSLWKYAYADRQLITFHHFQRYSYYDLSNNQILNVLQRCFDYYENMVQHHGVDTFLTYATASVWCVVAEAVAQHFGCNYFELTSTRYPDRTALLIKGIQRCDFAFNREPSEEDRQAAIDAHNKFRNHPVQPAWLSKKVVSNRKTVKLAKVLKLLCDYKTESADMPTIDVHDPGNLMPPLTLRLKEWVAFRLRLLLLEMNSKKLFETSIPGNREIAFFPLHVEPEAATMVLAQYFINMRSLIENIAKSLPVNYLLCVKEHPNMIGKRPLRYYEELSRIPNVVILGHEINSISVIKRSSLVTVITGTAGLEAAMLGKPVITFGRCHYNSLKTVRHFDKPLTELSRFISETIEKHQVNDELIVNFLSRMFANSVDLNASAAWGLDKFQQDYSVPMKICHLLRMYLGHEAKI